MGIACASTSAYGQVAFGFVGYGTRTGYGWPGYDYARVGRGGFYGPLAVSPWITGPGAIYGPAGPRNVTWYTPGLGYSSTVATGLPWQGVSPVNPRPWNGGDWSDGTMIARQDRQERARRRAELFYAARPRDLPRQRVPGAEPTVLPASTKEKVKQMPEPAKNPSGDASPK